MWWWCFCLVEELTPDHLHVQECGSQGLHDSTLKESTLFCREWLTHTLATSSRTALFISECAVVCMAQFSTHICCCTFCRRICSVILPCARDLSWCITLDIDSVSKCVYLFRSSWQLFDAVCWRCALWLPLTTRASQRYVRVWGVLTCLLLS